MPAQTVIKLRRSTAAQWTSANPTLAAGEPGLETDTGLVKYGDGTTAWTSLVYASSNGGGLTVSETAPADPAEGDMWFASAEAKTYVYYDSAWVEMSPAIVGPQGPQGETGATGPAGADGADGADGINGTNGTNGVDGEANFSSFLLMGA